MAFYSDFSRLNINGIVEQLREHSAFKPVIQKIDRYFKINPTSTANFIRCDKESISTPKFKQPNLDLSSLFFFSPVNDFEAAIACVSIFLYAIRHYDIIITNRLHVAIGAYWLNKKIELYDNSYHKIKNIYDFTLKNRPNQITIHFNVMNISVGDLFKNAFMLSVYPDRIDISK